jgi:hypothetical protein
MIPDFARPGFAPVPRPEREAPGGEADGGGTQLGPPMAGAAPGRLGTNRRRAEALRNGGHDFEEIRVRTGRKRVFRVAGIESLDVDDFIERDGHLLPLFRLASDAGAMEVPVHSRHRHARSHTVSSLVHPYGNDNGLRVRPDDRSVVVRRGFLPQKQAGIVRGLPGDPADGALFGEIDVRPRRGFAWPFRAGSPCIPRTPAQRTG